MHCCHQLLSHRIQPAILDSTSGPRKGIYWSAASCSYKQQSLPTKELLQGGRGAVVELCPALGGSGLGSLLVPLAFAFHRLGLQPALEGVLRGCCPLRGAGFHCANHLPPVIDRRLHFTICAPLPCLAEDL